MVPFLISPVIPDIMAEVYLTDDNEDDDDVWDAENDALSDATVQRAMFDSTTGDIDEGKTDEGKTDERKTDEEKTDEGTTDEGKTDERKTDEGRTDEGKTDEGTTDEGTTDEGKIQRKRKNECDKLLDSLSKNENITAGKKRNTKP